MMYSDTRTPARPALVSIIVSCYNAERYLQAAIESIFAQDYEHVEVIIVDDGSTDNSLDLLKALQKTYRFQLYQQTNQGVSAALNHGLKYARGVYVATPDLDDIMLPSSVRIRARYLDEHPTVGCVGALVTYMDGDGNDIKSESHSTIRYLDFDTILRKALVAGAPVSLYRMQALKDANGYDPQIRVQDFQMTLRIAALGYEIHMLPEIVTRYRRHPDNLSRKYKVLLNADLLSIEPYRDHPAYQAARTSVINKALKYSVITDKKYAWSLFRSIPLRHINRTTLRRFRRYLFHPENR